MNNPLFTFTSHAAGGDQFTVVSYTATEGLSSLYRYDITLKAPLSAAIDLDDMLDNPARFSIDTDQGESPVHGVLSTFDEVRMSGEYVFYQATLVPRLWKLSTYKTNEIYTTELTVDNIIRTVLDNADLKETVDFDISGVKNTLLQRDYVCQFRESDFAFISRLMENEGIYFFFEQGADSEILVIADDGKYDPVDMPDATFDTAPQSHRVGETVQSWLCRKQRLPENVTVRDYNPEQPSLDVYDTHSVDTAGQGTEYLYGENFLTETEAEHLAQVRAEEFICRKTRYYGESGICGLTAGYTFNLSGHPNDKYNDIDYLVVEVTHEGQFLDQSASDNTETSPIYNNTFVAIEASIPWRPPVKTPKPRFFGTMTAFVYAEATSEMAEINPEGCYRVHMPFDKADGSKDSTDPDRKASCWIRMAQPYVGEGEGMYFPLRGGTEVLLTFINGDPDRPVISGALPNASTPSLLTSEKPTESVIQTKGNNKIRMEDKPGSERVMMESPMANSWVRIGAPNDPVTLNGSATITVEIGDTYTEQGAFSSKDCVDTPITSPTTIRRADGTTETSIDTSSSEIYYLEYVHGTDTAIRTVIVGDELVDRLPGNGIRIQTSGNLFLEAQSQYADYTKGTPASASLPRKPGGSKDANQIGDLYDKFAGASKSYTPTGIVNYDGSSPTDPADFVASVFNSAHVQLSSLDTVNTQEGNIYDFGGYWNYNLGNSYEEAHINQSALLNFKHEGLSGSGDVSFPAASVGITAAAGVFTGIAVGIAAGAAGGKASAISAGVAGGLVGGAAAAIVNAISSGWGMADNAEARPLGDVIEGPNFGPIRSPNNKVKSSFIKIDETSGKPIEDEVLEQDIDEHKGASGNTYPMHTDTTWVTKSFGDTYEYSYGNTLGISIGHTEEHSKGDTYEYSYGGRSEETKFNGAGIMTYQSWSESGESCESSFNPKNGQLINVQYKNRAEHFIDAELTLPSTPTFSASCNIASMKTSAEFSTGININVSVSAGLSTNVAFNVGFAIEIEGNPSWKLELDDGEMVFKGPGTAFNKEAKLKGKIQTLMLKEYKMAIEKSSGCKITKENISIYDGALSMKKGFSIMGV